MKIIKVNDNYKVNIEHIYLLEKKTNSNDIYQWKKSYQEYLEMFLKDPPEFVDNDQILKIKFNEVNDQSKVEKYQEKLNEYILSIIGECPDYIETYHVLLASGLKIQIDKSLYEKLDEILNKYIIEL